ncbi:MAG: polysulfide reductase [Dehalococcoidia bacterium]|nr:MAG: polysulfide reductase [Dehalococcoidia bacterium]
MAGFIYPNEGLVEWDLLIVIYPYITGLVAGAFVVSSLYHVFGLKRLKPVSRFSLITALAFLMVTPLPLVMHLGRPERAFEMFLTPNLTSAMSAFGYIWFFYLLIVLAEVWLVFRPDITRYANANEGAKKTFYTVLALGVLNISEAAHKLDEKLIKVLAFIGVPVAFLLHGYVGFIFGAVKANPWWSTPLMPIIFLMSAIVSGISLLIVVYLAITRLRRAEVEHKCFHFMALWLGGFLTVAIVLEGLEIFSMFYEQEESWEIISQLISQQIPVSYFGIQFGIGSVLPLLLLALTALFPLKERSKTALALVSSCLVLVGVFAMRWNVVIGGQLISKSLRGFTSYIPPIWGINGLVTSIAVMILPFILLAVLVYLLPPWFVEEKPKPPERRGFVFRTSALAVKRES